MSDTTSNNNRFLYGDSESDCVKLRRIAYAVTWTFRGYPLPLLRESDEDYAFRAYADELIISLGGCPALPIRYQVPFFTKVWDMVREEVEGNSVKYANLCFRNSNAETIFARLRERFGIKQMMPLWYDGVPIEDMIA